jgi:DNA-binding response OmpR family regulator
MAKLYVVRLGYDDYAVKPSDVGKVLAALELLWPCKRRHYSVPFHLSEQTNARFSVELQEVASEEPPVSAQEAEDLAETERRRIAREEQRAASEALKLAAAT